MHVSEILLGVDADQTRRPTRGIGSAAGKATSITVEVPGKPPHDILVGVGLWPELPRRIRSLGLSGDVIIISSPRIYGLYGEQVESALRAGGCGRVVHALFPDGEEHKTLETFQDLCGEVHKAEEALGSKVLIVNLGGGVVGDVGGYVAACYDRGRDYIQLPTTLLGQVDCGIGGKCGVNFHGKNLIGAFHQPRLVISELSCLKSLPEREWRSGLAEVIKYGVILDGDLFAYLESNLSKVLARNLTVLEHLVVRSFQLKTDIVERDERDTLGIRAMLNFGHTVGHALEAATSYKRYAHGEAIAIGMLCACEIAERLDMLDPSVTKRVESLCRRVGLPTHIDDPTVDLNRVMQAMQHDKKFIQAKNRFVLPLALGRGELKDGVDDRLIRWVVNGRIRPLAE